MRYSLPDITLYVDMQIKPFKFNLKKISTEDDRLISALYDYLPRGEVRGSFLQTICDTIQRLVSKKASFELEAMHYEKFSDYQASLPSPAILSVFGMNPLNKKAICEIDPVLAIFLVERLLGGKPRGVPTPREISDTEQGILQYLILQVLVGIYTAYGENPKIHFRFDRFADGAKGVSKLARAGENVAILVFRLKIGKLTGFVRLAFPSPFLEEAFLDSALEAGPGEGDREYYANELKRFGYIRVPVWAEIGHLTLMPDELGAIEIGDTVLLDESYIEPAGEDVIGRAIVRIGDGKCGGIESDLEIDGSHARCTLRGMYKGD